jgi:hypothetical protein
VSIEEDPLGLGNPVLLTLGGCGEDLLGDTLSWVPELGRVSLRPSPGFPDPCYSPTLHRR